jgi:hypothetical protein
MVVSIVSMTDLYEVFFRKNSSSESNMVQKKSSGSICGTYSYQQGVRFFSRTHVFDNGERKSPKLLVFRDQER